MGIQSILYFVVSLCASVAGAICGIGGGVIIKPTLDCFGWDSVAAISFLSSCTVFSMAAYSVSKNLLSKGSKTKLNVVQMSPLAIGSILGGIMGNRLFSSIKNSFAAPDTVGAVQAICLFAVTAVVVIYTIRKQQIRTRQVNGPVQGALIGMGLGACSSFLGIGGGPINLMVLGYFYSMDSKTAAASSLYVILFSQAASITTTFLNGTTPAVNWIIWGLLVAGGIWGGVLGRKLNARMSNEQIDKLFIGMMGVIMLICVYNAWRFATL